MIDGNLLPFCERCTGVYLGLGVSFIYLLLTQRHKKDLPPRGIIYINIASLVIMPIFGFHLVDPGPSWRLWTGLIYGNAIATLMLSATSVICNRAKVLVDDTKTSYFQLTLLFALLNTTPFWFPIESKYFSCFVLTVSVTGLLSVLCCLAAVTISSVRNILVLLISRESAYEN